MSLSTCNIFEEWSRWYKELHLWNTLLQINVRERKGCSFFFHLMESRNHRAWERPPRSSSPHVHLPPIFPQYTMSFSYPVSGLHIPNKRCWPRNIPLQAEKCPPNRKVKFHILKHLCILFQTAHLVWTSFGRSQKRLLKWLTPANVSFNTGG